MARTTSKRNSRRTTSYSTRARTRAEPANLRPWLIGGGIVLLFGAMLFWYMLNGGWMQLTRGIYNMTAHAGLKVEEVFITGRTNLNRDELLATINVDRGDPILAIDLPAVHERLTANAWVDSARVERHLPNVLYVALIERKPFARWQSEQKLRLIDREGVVLSEQTDELQRFAALPLVVGDGAPKAAAEMIEALRDYPELRENTEALIRVGDRRWDMRLANGITLKLPDISPTEALDRVVAVWQSAGFAEKGVKVIDARLPDRLIIDNKDKDADDKVGKP